MSRTRTVTAGELRAKLGEILDAASSGETILIERDHRPVAYLISPEEQEARDEVEREARIKRQLKALDDLVAFGIRMRERYPPPDDGLTDAEWIKQERDRRADHIDRAARGRPPDTGEDGVP